MTLLNKKDGDFEIEVKVEQGDRILEVTAYRCCRECKTTSVLFTRSVKLASNMKIYELSESLRNFADFMEGIKP